MNIFNSFEKPDVEKPVNFTVYSLNDGILTIKMPSKSVIKVITDE